MFAVDNVEYKSLYGVKKIKKFRTIDGIEIDGEKFKSKSVQTFLFAYDDIDSALKALVRYPDKYENGVIITKYPVYIGKGGDIIKKISKLGGKNIKVEKRT